MPEVEYRPQLLEPVTFPPRQSALMVSIPRPGAPAAEFELNPGFNIVDGELLEEAFAQQGFGKILKAWEEQGVIVVKRNQTNAIASEPDLTSYSLTEAVKKIKGCTSMTLLGAWRDIDARKGVQNAIEAQIKSLQPDGEVSK